MAAPASAVRVDLDAVRPVLRRQPRVRGAQLHHIDVDATHIGMPAHPDVFRHIGAALADWAGAQTLTDEREQEA